MDFMLNSKKKKPWLWRRPAGEAEETGFSLERVAGSASASHETDFQPSRARQEHRREKRGGGCTGAAGGEV